MDSYSETERCPKCGKEIALPNFQIHQAMCRGVRQSFIFNVNDPEYKKMFEQPHSEEHNEQQKDSPPKHESEHRNKIFEKSKTEEKREIQKPKEIPREEEKKPLRIPSVIESIPCPNCGYNMSMAELDTHPQKCAMHPKTCPYCKEEYPETLMHQHKKVCEKRPRE